LPLPLANAIASLPPGAVSAAPVVVGNARYLVKVEQARPVKAPPYEEVAPGLRKALEAQEMERALVALTADLIRNAAIAQ
jgi:peptidyl-prolyl cis-trans isomerase C